MYTITLQRLISLLLVFSQRYAKGDNDESGNDVLNDASWAGTADSFDLGRSEEKAPVKAENGEERYITFSARDSQRPARPKAFSINSLYKGVEDDYKTTPADHLCPFVGYHGSYCPIDYQARSAEVSTSDSIPLPKGVGLTLDVTNGELKLPVLTYTDSERKWVDRVTGVSYTIPRVFY